MPSFLATASPSSTSTPRCSTPVFPDRKAIGFRYYDAAFADPRWSSGSIDLTSGTFEITGIATLAPFGAGAGAIRIDAIEGTVTPVPLPGAALLLLSGLALAGLLRRPAA